MGGRGRRNAAGAGAPPTGKDDRSRAPGSRVREYPLEEGSADELSKAEALLAARLLQAAEIELLPTRSLWEAATRLAIELDHPAYDCLYLALAIASDCQFVTADQRFLRKLDQGRRRALRARATSLTEAAQS